METKIRYCAFGIGYLDCKGEIIEESENYYIVKAEGYGVHKLALTKNEKLTKVFDTKEKRNEWIEKQNYQYDDR
jgi:hypothetical protein